jgi:hypothetical protein
VAISHAHAGQAGTLDPSMIRTYQTELATILPRP